MAAPSPDALVARLVAELAVPQAAALEAVLLGRATSPAQALALLDQASHGPCPWAALYSTRYDGRPYYHCKEMGATTWDEPESHALHAGRVDCAAFGLTTAHAAALARLLDELMAAERPAWPAARDTLRALLTNALLPGSGARRGVNLANDKVAARLARLPPARPLLLLCGFRPVPGSPALLELPAAAPTAAARCVLSRLEAACALTDDTAGGGAAGGAGGGGAAEGVDAGMRRYQRRILACACCARAINDGSERVRPPPPGRLCTPRSPLAHSPPDAAPACPRPLRRRRRQAITGRWDAPRGQYRFECGACGGSLCEACEDRANAGDASAHPPSHGARAPVAPYTDRLAASGGAGAGAESEGNPWGRFGASVSARSRERLKERSGM